MAYQSFEDLEVWQRGCRLAVDIFKTFDGCKNFTFKDQIQKAGLSVPCNIAEGSERGTLREFSHFLNISKGSCGELRTQLYIARKLKSLPKPPLNGSFPNRVKFPRCLKVSAGQSSEKLGKTETHATKKADPFKA